MKKYFSAILIAMLLVTTTAWAEPAKPQENSMNLNCRSALLMEAGSGKIVYELNSHEKLAPASVTKVMTMLLTMEAVENGAIKLEDKVTISERAKAMGGSTMYLETGEIRTVEELLKGVGIESANDAAVALAEFIGGSQEGFVEKMNARAKELGMNDTNFVNPHGFYDPNHYTSANDVAVMSKELIKHSRILDYTKIWMETITEGRKEPFTLVNRNKMLKSYNGCDGLKTGFTKEAKYCISATAKRGNIRFISVIMGADSWKERNSQASKLLDIGFAKYESVDFIKKDEVIQEIALPKSKPEKVKVMAKDDLNLVFEKGAKPKIEKKVEISKDLKLPIKKGDSIGVVRAVEGDKVYGEIDIVADQDITKINMFDTLGKCFRGWINVE